MKLELNGKIVMKLLKSPVTVILLCIFVNSIAAPPDPNITDVVLNELLFNPGDISPVTNLGQDCDGDGVYEEDGSSNGNNADDEFIEFYNNGATDVDLSGYCISNNQVQNGDPSVGTNNSWLIPPGVTVPAGGFYHICGEDDGRGFGFSIADSSGNQVSQFSNNSGTNTWASLYEPTTPGDCTSVVQTVIFSEDYGDGESNGEPFLRCFTDGVSPLGFYDDGSGNFYVPTPGSANCTIATPVYVNSVKYQDNIVSWQTGLEFKHLGFNLYDSNGNKLNQKLIISDQPNNYSFGLKEINPDAVILASVDTDGTEHRLDYVLKNTQYGIEEKNVNIDWSQSKHEKMLESSARVYQTQIKVLVSDSGIQRVLVSDLLSQNFNVVGKSIKNLQLTRNNETISLYLDSNSKSISKNDAIYFLGDKASSIYSDEAIYTLRIVQNNTNRIQEAKAAPNYSSDSPKFYVANQTIEENNHYEFSSSSSDPWMMKKLLVYTEPKTTSWQFELSALAEEYVSPTNPVTVSANIVGVTDFPGTNDDHNIGLQINDSETVFQTFDGQQEVDIFNYASNVTNNSLSVQLFQPGDSGYDYDLVNLNKFNVTYPRRFIANEGQIDFEGVASEHYQIEGFNSDDLLVFSKTANKTYVLKDAEIRYLRWSLQLHFSNPFESSQIYISELNKTHSPRLLATNSLQYSKTDFLILTRSDFIPFLQNYVSEKQAQGFNVGVFDVDSVITSFSDTYNNPDALKQFIAELHRKNPLQYVMIVGSDQYDYKNYLNTNAVSIVPTFYRNTGDGIHHAPTDVPFVDFDNDDVADIPLGRLIANNTTELQQLLNKISTYNYQNFNSEIFITDNKDSDRFNAIAADLSLQSPLQSNLIRIDELGIEQARQKLIENLNSGSAFVNWIGHSSPTRWSQDNVFDVNNVAELQNPPTVFMQLGCWNSYFVDPIKQYLSGALLQSPNYGAVATIGSSTYTKSDGETEFVKYFKQYINSNRNPTLGKAFNYALKQYAQTNPERKDILLGYQLLGDPTMIVR